MNKPRKARIASAAVLVASFVAAFATLGGIGVAESAVSAIQKQYGGEKVTICHKGKKTITVSKSALPAHAKHGDAVGTCAQVKAKKAKAAKAKAAKAKAAKAKAAKAKAKKAETETSGSSGKGKGKGK